MDCNGGSGSVQIFGKRLSRQDAKTPRRQGQKKENLGFEIKNFKFEISNSRFLLGVSYLGVLATWRFNPLSPFPGLSLESPLPDAQKAI
jgi:hypothetical protein